MSSTLTAHPSLPSRVWTIAIAAAVLVAVVVTTVLLTIAIADRGQSNEPLAPVVALAELPGADFSQTMCEPARTPAPC